ncbi:acetylxylan esterase [Ligilactobacillus ruminis]|uniref:acetylxylan esterase n=1 Tax=Ligilactobacillus ruminis TaxID=1623 RepID=UPI0022E8601D|nr:acetylxylan esterase [Ligilactobacillus ruminis]
MTDYRAVYDVCAFDELGYWFRYHDSLRKNENEFFRLIDYVDVKHQAENIKAEVVMVIGPKTRSYFPKSRWQRSIGTIPKKLLVLSEYGREHRPKISDELRGFFELGK